MSTLVILPGTPERWVRIAEGAIEARGDDLPPAGEDRVVSVIPARDVTIHRAALPGLTEPQARAAARLLAAEASATPPAELHVATGAEDAQGERMVVALAAPVMAAHLERLARLGHDPATVLAEPLLLPLPEDGWVKGDLGDGPVLRGRETGFADDPALTPLITGAAAITDLDRDTLEAALVAAVAAPEVDLRQGMFARSRRWTIEWPLVRRIAALGALLALATLAFQIVRIVKLNAAAAQIEAANRIRARAALPPGTIVDGDPVTRLDARLAALGGARNGFLPLAGAVAAAVNDTATAELLALRYDAVAGLKATVRGDDAGAPDAVARRLAARDLDVTTGPQQSDATRPTRELTVRAR